MLHYGHQQVINLVGCAQWAFSLLLEVGLRWHECWAWTCTAELWAVKPKQNATLSWGELQSCVVIPLRFFTTGDTLHIINNHLIHSEYKNIDSSGFNQWERQLNAASYTMYFVYKFLTYTFSCKPERNFSVYPNWWDENVLVCHSWKKNPNVRLLFSFFIFFLTVPHSLIINIPNGEISEIYC